MCVCLFQGDTDKEKDVVKKPKKPTVKYVDLPIISCTASLTKKELDLANETEVCLSASARSNMHEVGVGMPYVIVSLFQNPFKID